MNTICELSDLPVEQCACRMHAKGEPVQPRHGGTDMSWNGYPVEGVAGWLGKVTDDDVAGEDGDNRQFRLLLATVRREPSAREAMNLLAKYCSDSSHWIPRWLEIRSRRIALLVSAVAVKTDTDPTRVLACVADAGYCPRLRDDRHQWVLSVRNRYDRLFGPESAPGVITAP